MTQVINGIGQGLPTPANLYPQYLVGTGSPVPYDAPTNILGLGAGDAAYIPAESGDYLLNVGNYSFLQWLDPVTGIWRSLSASRSHPFHFRNNGSESFRIANLLGCPVAAIVAGGGSGFAQATATITANVGGSTWLPIVGGSLSVSTISVVGANYTVPPLVMIPVPPNPGVAASAHATITNGTVTSVVFDNFGAGYPSAPTAVIVPSPFDVNFASITQATVVFGVVNSGKITAALCTNNGAPLATLTALTLTAAGGAGMGATITPLVLQTATAGSIVAGGGGWGNAAAPAKLFSVNGSGNVSVSAITNPSVEATGFVPRDVDAYGVCNAGGTITSVTIVDGGLFLQQPTAAIAPGGTLPTTLASITWTMGTSQDSILIQPM